MSKMRFSVARVAAVFSLASGSLAAQAPPGYHVGAPIILPDTLVEDYAGGRFRATVLRSYRTPFERDLIATAERLYPDSATILASARQPEERKKLDSLASGKPDPFFKIVPREAGTPADRWWRDSFDATWLPFAVTGGSVNYYLGRLRDLAAGRSQFVVTPKDIGDHGSFDYHASVRPSSDAGTAYVAELQIRWDYWCGFLCAVEFMQTRTVWFDVNGRVVRLEGDGVPLVVVS